MPLSFSAGTSPLLPSYLQHCPYPISTTVLSCLLILNVRTKGRGEIIDFWCLSSWRDGLVSHIRGGTGRASLQSRWRHCSLVLYDRRQAIALLAKPRNNCYNVAWRNVCAAPAISIESVVDVGVERDSCSKQRCENNANLVPRSSSCMPKI